MTDDELKQLIASNAKSIEALSSSLAAERQERQRAYIEWGKDRNQLYQYLGRIAAAQSSFYEVQADYYHQLSILGERQANLAERQTRVEERQTRVEERLIRLLERFGVPDEDVDET